MKWRALEGALRVRLADGGTLAVDDLTRALVELAEAVDREDLGRSDLRAARVVSLARSLGVLVPVEPLELVPDDPDDALVMWDTRTRRTPWPAVVDRAGAVLDRLAELHREGVDVPGVLERNDDNEHEGE